MTRILSEECPLCSHYHCFRECPAFHVSKARTAQSPYSDRYPHPAEELGFMAAGILLVDAGGRVMMIRETRNKVDKFNFIGGKRECRRDSWCALPRLETAFETACTEFEEETGQSLDPEAYSSVIWFPQSKFLLFIVPSVEDSDPISRCSWFSIKDLETGLERRIFHDYIRNQVSIIIETPQKCHDERPPNVLRTELPGTRSNLNLQQTTEREWN